MRRKWKIWLIGIPAFFVLLLIALHIAAFLWINPIADKMLRESVRNCSRIISTFVQNQNNGNRSYFTK